MHGATLNPSAAKNQGRLGGSTRSMLGAGGRHPGGEHLHRDATGQFLSCRRIPSTSINLHISKGKNRSWALAA